MENPIIERVKKLLKLSQSSNIHEANAALSAANKLIDQHRLSQVDLECEQQEPVVEDSSSIYSSGRITGWKFNLMNTLSHHYGCTWVQHKSYRNKNYTLIGRQSDIEIVRYMFAWLSLEAERLAHFETKQIGHNKSEGKIFCHSYLTGFVNGLKEQLIQSRQEASIGASTQAIVKINSRAEEAKIGLNKFYPGIKPANNKLQRPQNADAFYSGKQKGKDIHLGASLNKASGIKLLRN